MPAEIKAPKPRTKTIQHRRYSFEVQYIPQTKRWMYRYYHHSGYVYTRDYPDEKTATREGRRLIDNLHGVY